jgi:hypothetical protein
MIIKKPCKYLKNFLLPVVVVDKAMGFALSASKAEVFEKFSAKIYNSDSDNR